MFTGKQNYFIDFDWFICFKRIYGITKCGCSLLVLIIRSVNSLFFNQFPFIKNSEIHSKSSEITLRTKTPFVVN